MKITLNELRQMVRNIISEMDGKYIASSNDNFMTVTQTDVDDEEYEIKSDTSRLQEVINLVSEKANFIVTNCISFSSVKDYEYEYGLIERMNDVKEGEFKAGNGNYDYYIVEDNNGEQRILVRYDTKYGRGYYGEDFIFEGYLDEEEDEEYRDEYPRNWTNPEEL